VRDILLLLMGFAALHRGSVPVPVADGIADACFGREKAAEKPAVPKNTRRVCAACGKPLEKDAVFCPECGARNEVRK
ncbi:MAG: zinc ribbon domain-containing protein, partial [Butyricicoccus sp.]